MLVKQRQDDAQTPLIEEQSNQKDVNTWLWKGVLLLFLGLFVFILFKDLKSLKVSEKSLGTTPQIQINDQWIVEIPYGQVSPGVRIAPNNYATFSNPWATLPEGRHVSAPIQAFSALHFPWTSKVHIKSLPAQGIYKSGFKCQMEGQRGILPDMFMIKVLEKWHPAPGMGEVPQGWAKEVSDIYHDYEIQVALSYLSYIYSMSGAFKSSSKRLQWPRKGKFAYSHPALVKIIDSKSKMWTLGLIDHYFEVFVKPGEGDVDYNNLKRAEDFGRWVSDFTGLPTFPTAALQVNDEQGFWFLPPSLYMSDGQLYKPRVDLPEMEQQGDVSSAREFDMQDYEEQIEEIQKCISGAGGLLEILAIGAEKAPQVRKDYFKPRVEAQEASTLELDTHVPRGMQSVPVVDTSCTDGKCVIL